MIITMKVYSLSIITFSSVLKHALHFSCTLKAGILPYILNILWPVNDFSAHRCENCQ